MSDWTDEIIDFEERNWDDLAEGFIQKNAKLWDEYVSDKFFNRSCLSLGVNEDGGDDR